MDNRAYRVFFEQPRPGSTALGSRMCLSRRGRDKFELRANAEVDRHALALGNLLDSLRQWIPVVGNDRPQIEASVFCQFTKGRER